VPSILLATADPILRETRQLLLRQFGFEVKAPIGKQQALELIDAESFGFLILGNTLPEKTRIEIASVFRQTQPHARIIEILASPGETPTTNPDAVVVGLDGPLALRAAIEAQLK
jgi:DNA-binding response OmpR family regulator